MIRDTVSLETTITALGLLLLTQVMLVPAVRLTSLLFLSLSLYACTAWLSFKYGQQNYDPWPSLLTVQIVTRIDITCVLLTALATEAVFGAEAIDSAIRHAASEVRERIVGLDLPVAEVLLTFGLLAVGIRDGIKTLSIGIGDVLSGERRQYANELLLTSDHNVQVLCIAASVFLVVRIALGNAGILPIISLATAWLPFVIVGSRKELLLIAAITLVILAGKIRRRTALLLAFGFVAILVFPTIKTGNLYASTHEFALPQYMHFSVAMGLVPKDLGGTFVEGAQLLLPSFLRFTEVTSLGQEFDLLNVTGVGIGASPFAQAELYSFFGNIYSSFVVLYILLVSVMVLASKKFPVATCTLFGLMLIYGRSDFWILLFFALYLTLTISGFMIPLTKSTKRRYVAAGRTDGG